MRNIVFNTPRTVTYEKLPKSIQDQYNDWDGFQFQSIDWSKTKDTALLRAQKSDPTYMADIVRFCCFEHHEEIWHYVYGSIKPDMRPVPEIDEIFRIATREVICQERFKRFFNESKIDKSVIASDLSETLDNDQLLVDEFEGEVHFQDWDNRHKAWFSKQVRSNFMKRYKIDADGLAYSKIDWSKTTQPNYLEAKNMMLDFDPALIVYPKYKQHFYIFVDLISGFDLCTPYMHKGSPIFNFYCTLRLMDIETYLQQLTKLYTSKKPFDWQVFSRRKKRTSKKETK